MFTSRSVKLITITCISALAFMGIWLLLKSMFIPKAALELKAGTYLNAKLEFEDFKLQDTNGYPFTAQSLKGYWTLMFFGYSNCPNVCPKTLSFVNSLWKSLSASKNKPDRFIFASINPKTDNTKTLKSFLHNFNTEFIGVTGKMAEINKLTSPLGIFVKPNNDDGIETIEHSSSIMLINPQGNIIASFSPPFKADIILQDLQKITKY